MFSKKVVQNLVGSLSTTSLMAATVYASEVIEKDKETTNLIRPRDLSIYSKPEKQSKAEKESATEEESSLLAVVRLVREGVWSVTGQLNQVTDKFNHVVETGKAHTSTAIQTLREDENYVQRYGAIAAGGLLGYIVAIRRGWFRRILYTTAGATAVAAVCYPEEADQYGSEALREGKHYVIIAYHFVNGVLRDYVGVQLPGQLPLGISSGGDKDTPSSAALMPPPASGPSHVPAGPIPLPPLDLPSNVAGDKKKQGTKNESSDENERSRSEPKPLSFIPSVPSQKVAEHIDDYSSLYTRRGI